MAEIIIVCTYGVFTYKYHKVKRASLRVVMIFMIVRTYRFPTTG